MHLIVSDAELGNPEAIVEVLRFRVSHFMGIRDRNEKNSKTYFVVLGFFRGLLSWDVVLYRGAIAFVFVTSCYRMRLPAKIAQMIRVMS